MGWGVYATTSVKGPNRFALARQWWHEELKKLAVTDSVHFTGTGPLLFTSFSFSPDEESVLVIPKVIVGQRADQSWITWIGDIPQPNLVDEVEPLHHPEFQWRNGTLSSNDWEERVAVAIHALPPARSTRSFSHEISMAPQKRLLIRARYCAIWPLNIHPHGVFQLRAWWELLLNYFCA